MISNLEEKGDEQQLHELSDENHMRNGIDQNHDMEMKLVKRYANKLHLNEVNICAKALTVPLYSYTMLS